ncbi:MAG TPA: glutamine-hydrolyzing carbamoyl-phosphate synthase small subunit [Candidatus Nitrosopolaris sp.]|nr:glutamine-hydrolyzing carbamoyl-phosphate synthase small subunit [Candidatus Nitrosopolaris sp.]
MLEDGSIFTGIGFGYPAEVTGEVVFNTGMVGYTETLTDPSYRGQILCLTYPSIGNYGVPGMGEVDDFGLPRFFESDKIQVKGLLIHELSVVGSHWTCVKTLDEWLYEQRIPGICNIDTRALTKKLRIYGVMIGALGVSPVQEEVCGDPNTVSSEINARLSGLIKNYDYGLQNFMPEVSTTSPTEYGDKCGATIVLLDVGTKKSIIRNILRLGFRVVCLPWDTSFEEVMSYKPNGVVISNGPGDPKVCTTSIKTAAELINKSVPTLGICLGNQILALAGGGDTYKLKFGHRGQNKPCIDLRTNRTYITSQNHGYGIDPESLDGTGFKVWFSSVDDHTVEGFEHESKPIIAVQFHPEASPGPYDCIFVFDRFKELIEDFYGKSLSEIICQNAEDNKDNDDNGSRGKLPIRGIKKQSKEEEEFCQNMKQ